MSHILQACDPKVESIRYVLCIRLVIHWIRCCGCKKGYCKAEWCVTASVESWGYSFQQNQNMHLMFCVLFCFRISFVFDAKEKSLRCCFISVLFFILSFFLQFILRLSISELKVGMWSNIYTQRSRHNVDCVLFPVCCILFPIYCILFPICYCMSISKLGTNWLWTSRAPLWAC